MSIASNIASSIRDAAEAILAALIAADVTKADIGRCDLSVRLEAKHEPREEVQPAFVLVGEDEKVIEEESSQRVLLGYPVLVILTMFRENTREQADFRFDVRERVRTGLWLARLAMVPQVCNVEYEPTASIDTGSWEQGMLVSAQRFTWWVETGRLGV